MKKILYIGNNFAENSKYHSAMETLSSLLISKGFLVVKSSSKKNRILRLFAMCTAIIKLRNKVDFILIDTFSTLNFWYAVLISQLARLFKIDYISILHGGNLPHRLHKKPFLSKLIFNNSYKNVTPSKYLEVEFNKCNFKTEYIPNPIVLADYQFIERKNSQPNLLWVRAFDKIYNPLLAVNVLFELKKEFPKTTLCMVGPDKDGTLDEAKKLAKKLRIYKSIKFTGVLPKEEWHQLSIKYDIFINTTTIDNMPVSIIEAMALGFPIVSTNVGGLPYLIDNEIDGLLVLPNNEIEMVNAIKRLINSPTLTNKLSTNARKKAATLDIEGITNQWLKLLT